MRLIDADAIPSMGISNFSVMFRKVIDEMPTIDQWHYPSKGELPKEGETVLLLTNEGDPYLGQFANEYFWETDSFVRTSACIKCWQYIVPPKEEA